MIVKCIYIKFTFLSMNFLKFICYLLIFKILFIFILCIWVYCLNICAPIIYTVPIETWIWHQISWNWISKCLWTTMLILRTESCFLQEQWLLRKLYNLHFLFFVIHAYVSVYIYLSKKEKCRISVFCKTEDTLTNLIFL